VRSSCGELVCPSRLPLLRKHTVATYGFNWMTAYVSKHNHIVSNGVLCTVLCLAYLRARDLAIATLIYIPDLLSENATLHRILTMADFNLLK
jgi:hypothetical protein